MEGWKMGSVDESCKAGLNYSLQSVFLQNLSFKRTIKLCLLKTVIYVDVLDLNHS